MAEDRWIMRGLDAEDPDCIRSVPELETYIEKVGFLPLFRSEIPGFSVEEHVATDDWWTGDPETDPWEWRKTIASGGRIAYGKFFGRKAGFISKEWFPTFANYRRDGYDFDARWDDELAGIRSKRIMDLFMEENMDRELFAADMKQEAGLGKDKSFDSEIVNLQMQTYLCIGGFKRKVNKAGNEYGWGVAVYCTPEHLWGYDHIASGYSEEPSESAAKLAAHLGDLFPEASVSQIVRCLGMKAVSRVSEKVPVYPDNLIKALKMDGFSSETATGDQKTGLEVAIGQLRAKHARVIDMKYRQNMTYEEIGIEMNRAAGTVSGYHSKALGKLRWPEVAAWYLEGYKKTAGMYYPEGADAGHSDPEEELCLIIGLSLRQFDALSAGQIRTVSDLRKVLEKPAWFKSIRGIGEKTSRDIEEKLNRYCQRNSLTLAFSFKKRP